MVETRRSSEKRPVQNRTEIEDYIAARPGVEFAMARGMVRRLVIVGPIMLALFGVLKGVDGLVAAAAGIIIVAGYYLLTGWILSATVRVSLGTYYAGALFGFLVRIVLIGLTMALLTSQYGLDRVALGATVAVTYVVLLMWEAATFRTSASRVGARASQITGDTSGV